MKFMRLLMFGTVMLMANGAGAQNSIKPFHIDEATISDVHAAYIATSTALDHTVESLSVVTWESPLTGALALSIIVAQVHEIDRPVILEGMAAFFRDGSQIPRKTPAVRSGSESDLVGYAANFGITVILKP